MNEQKYYDILFDPNNEVVEKEHQETDCHTTVLYVNGKVAATRTITSEGVTFS